MATTTVASAATTSAAMECEVCMEELDLQARRPKSLPCGHTTCLRCLQRLRDLRCPQCRKEIRVAVNALPDNYFVLSRIEAAKAAERSARPTAWCVNCSRVAASGCAAGHTVRGLGAALRRQLQDLLPQAGRRLQDLQEEDALRACAEGQLLDALELLAGPASDSAADCLLTVQRGDSVYTAHWGAEGAQDALLQALVAALAVKGKLAKVTGNKGSAAAAQTKARTPAPPRLATPAVVPAAPAPAVLSAPTPAVSAPVSRGIASISVKTFSMSYPNEYAAEKRDVLNRIRREGVRRLVCVNCESDPGWVVQLLKAAAPTVSQLNLFHPRLQHLQLLRNMRQLKRLDLCNDWSHDVLYDEEGWDLDQFGDWQAGQGLKRLRVRGDRGLPRTMLWYLLRAHNATLEELELQVGTPGQEADMSYAWPGKCNDLHIMLRDIQLPALRRLDLDRTHEDEANDHSVRACNRQFKKLRAVLAQHVEIYCDSRECESDSEECSEEEVVTYY